MLIFQFSLVVVIGLFLVAFNINMADQQKNKEVAQSDTDDQEVIQTKDVTRTVHKDQPPRPPSPQTPVEVPNAEIIEGDAQKELAELDQQLSSGKKMALPEPPEKEKSEEKVFKVVEKQPKLIGGLDTLQKMIDYPDMAQKAGIQGRVYVQFVVNKQGKVEDPKIIRGPGAGLNKEALRVIKKARFQPGIQQGHPVKVRYSMPIIFHLGEVRG